MYNILSFLIFSLLFSCLNAQENSSKNSQNSFDNYVIINDNQSDFLTPPKSSLNSRRYEHRYDQILRHILFDGLPEYFDIQYYAAPSFNAESVLYLRKGILYYHIANKSIWDTYYNHIMSNSDLKDTKENTILVKRYQMKISNENSELLERLYRAALAKTCYRIYTPEELNRVSLGNDGTTYSFSIHNLGVKEGETWSPAQGSRMSRLVKIHESLINLITRNEADEILKLHQSLVFDIKKLIDEFNLIELSFEKHTIKTIKDTIIGTLNKNVNIRLLKNEGYYVADDLIYRIKKGKIKTVKPQKIYYNNYSDFRNWFNALFDKNVGKTYKKALKDLDLSYLNLELNLDVYLDLQLDKENYNLEIRN